MVDDDFRDDYYHEDDHGDHDQVEGVGMRYIVQRRALLSPRCVCMCVCVCV
jgi:hypothetical protein